jgi:RimJ/RimL family protein N-acetyltransferase
MLMVVQVIVREVTREDRKALFEWRSDQTLTSVHPSTVHLAYREHCRWFDYLLNDPDSLFFVGVLETLRIGGVRFTRQPRDVFEVHMFLKPSFAGKGYGTILLKESLAYLTEIKGPQKIFARVKYLNLATRRTFENAGFKLVSEEGLYLGFEWAL